MITKTKLFCFRQPHPPSFHHSRAHNCDACAVPCVLLCSLPCTIRMLRAFLPPTVSAAGDDDDDDDDDDGRVASSLFDDFLFLRNVNGRPSPAAASRFSSSFLARRHICHMLLLLFVVVSPSLLLLLLLLFSCCCCETPSLSITCWHVFHLNRFGSFVDFFSFIFLAQEQV